MKNITKLLLVVLVSLLSANSNAQIFRIIGGLNLSNMLIKNDLDTYSDDFKMNPGFHIGGTIEFPLSNRLSLGTGLLIDTKGFIVKEEGQDWYQKEKLNLYYLDIPIVLKVLHDFESGIKVYGVVGPYFGVGLVGKIKNEHEYQGQKDSDKEDVEWGNDEYEDFFKRFDSGLTFGGGVEIKAILIGISYDLGLYNISPYSSANGFKMNNRVLRFSIGYRLGNTN
jgi:hypothetical protein